jgi:hypothetical protein
MRRPRGRVRYAIALLIALLLAPLLARGVHHAHDSMASTCVVCTVTKHTPTVAPASLAALAPVLVRMVFSAPAVTGAIAGDHPIHGGRAPPVSTARTA